jgi:hypothetical protein
MQVRVSQVDVFQHYKPFDLAFIIIIIEVKLVLNGMFHFRLREFTEK